MSTYLEEPANCPSCSASFTFRLAYGINVVRRPEDRAELLADTLQRAACPECGTAIRAEPRFTWLSLQDDQWILVEPAANVTDWRAFETEARALFRRTYGGGAPEPAREIGATLRSRVVFGWAALREKVLCAEHRLDDVELELLKMALVRSLSDQPVADEDLRLIGSDADGLELAWLDAQSGAVSETLRVPRKAYDAITADEAWVSLRDDLRSGFFVDMNRLLVTEA